MCTGSLININVNRGRGSIRENSKNEESSLKLGGTAQK